MPQFPTLEASALWDRRIEGFSTRTDHYAVKITATIGAITAILTTVLMSR